MKRLFVFAAIITALIGVEVATSADDSRSLFTKITSDESGLDYKHRVFSIKELADSIGKVNLMVPGCGVSIGDLTGDGRPEIIMTGFSGIGVYRNDGNMKFTDISDDIGVPVSETYFSSAANLVDIDGDGDLDIFLARWMAPCKFLINDGTGQFVDKASEMGVDIVGESVHSVCFDADRDGDLDLYVVRYSKNTIGMHYDAENQEEIADEAERRQRSRDVIPKYTPPEQIRTSTFSHEPDPSAGDGREDGQPDVMFRNNGDGTFTDVSERSWMVDNGFGLSATASDINLDGWPDVYVANDFHITDLIYMNNRDGTFANLTHRMTRRASQFSMGSEVADLNNDGLPDIMTTDMRPRTHKRRMVASAENGLLSRYNPFYDSNQVVRNMVQLNRGYDQFSEVGFLTNMTATDWSWACLFVDFDLDGMNDVFVASGYKDDVADSDYLNNLQLRNSDMRTTIQDQELMLRLPNHVFKQTAYMKFDDVSNSWGVVDTAASFGAAYGDLDGDGDLDLVVANLDTQPDLFRNNAIEQKRGNYLNIVLDTQEPNPTNMGAKVRVVVGKRTMYKEFYPIRGYQGCMSNMLTFGLGDASKADSVIVEWPNQKVDVALDVAGNATHIMKSANAVSSRRKYFVAPDPKEPLFIDRTEELRMLYLHTEDKFDDFKRYRLAPLRLSWGGPSIAVGDITGNGRDDVLLGSSKGNAAVAFTTSNGKRYEPLTLDALTKDSAFEDQAMLIIDVTGDKHNDIVIVGGGPEFYKEGPRGEFRVYANDGKGNFSPLQNPQFPTNATALVAADYDGDGDLDLFVGGGVKTDTYPYPARSYILQNDGKGHFKDVTSTVAPGLEYAGIIRSALWTDPNGDGLIDLMVTGEWMPLSYWKNTGETFKNETVAAGLGESTGWWFSVTGADLDNDGDIDYVCGNFGKNSIYTASAEGPLELYAADFDDNGSIDPIITYHIDGGKHLIQTRPMAFAQMPTLHRQYNTYQQWADAKIEDFAEPEALDTCLYKAVKVLESSVFMNDGAGKFTRISLPLEAQLSPGIGIKALDADQDENLDLLICGNMYGAEENARRYDAGKGLLLTGNGNGTFSTSSMPESGFVTHNDSRGLALADFVESNGKQNYLLVAPANQSYTLVHGPYRATGTKVEKIGNSQVTSATIELLSGRRAVELYYGDGYRSQSSRVLVVPGSAQSVTYHQGDKTVSQSQFK